MSTTARIGHSLTVVIPVILFAAVALVLMGGCGGPKKGAEEAVPTAAPSDLGVEVNDHSMIVQWRFDNSAHIAGYNIYISETPLVEQYPGTAIRESIDPWNSSPYPGDTNPEDGVVYYDATGLDNGVKYYVSVRAVFSDWSLSRPSSEVVAVCGPRGEMELAVRYSGAPDGFSFAQNDYVEADASTNDLYYFAREGEDILGAPSRLNGYLRANRFHVLTHSGDFQSVSERVNESSINPENEQVNVKAGDWVLMKTVEGSHALVHVDGFSGAGSDRRVQLSYAYSPITGEVFF